ncbi:MAG: nuclear transport factor 2 family protein [Halieaceae bacterium]|nr:nuclear transport factor 2 family protein [Halieaceae bacterium]
MALDLEAIELIKQLKARYFRFLDTRNIEGLHSVFTEDASARFKGPDYDFDLNGWPALEAFYRKSFSAEAFGMHNGHHPEIEVSGDHATGIWYLQDIFVQLKHDITVMGSALYEDEYRREGGVWRIATTGYVRLWEEHHARGDHVKLRVKPIPDA